MLHLKILTIGKTKEKWLEEALSEYIRRLNNSVKVSITLAKDDGHLASLAEQQTQVVCLDPAGREMTSEEFSTFVMGQFEEGGSHLVFVIGGAEGLPNEMKMRYPLVSLSKLTFTHQITRLVLVEQVYRALEIARGSRYHK